MKDTLNECDNYPNYCINYLNNINYKFIKKRRNRRIRNDS